MKTFIIKKTDCLFFFLPILLLACVESTDDAIEGPGKEVTKKSVSIPSETINQIIKSVPSPLELTSIIKGTGIQFNKDLLNNTSNSKNYTSTFRKAVNLGIYGADLGYINMYEKTYASIEYLTTVRSLADDLELGHFFDFETLKRLSANNSKLDSIVYISTSSFEKMNNYLAKQKRENISILMLVGGWIESTHLTCQVSIETGNQELINRIGEQKVTLDQIIILMKLYKDDPSFTALNKNIDSLKILYDDVKIVYEYKEPITKEVDGMLIVENVETSTVAITKEQFEKISQLISQTRNDLINI